MAHLVPGGAPPGAGTTARGATGDWEAIEIRRHTGRAARSVAPRAPEER